MATKDKGGLSRRNMLSLGGGVAALAAGGAITPAPAQAPAPTNRTKGKGVTQVTVTQGTNIAPQLSPDGASIAFDLYGVLWVIPAAGGVARRLTDEYGDIGMPDWAPDSQSLVFQSYRSGNFQIWSIKADGTGLKQLTDGPFDCREPRFAPDGKTVVFSSDRTGSYGIHTVSVDGGATKPLIDTRAEEFEPAWSPDGKSVAIVVDKVRVEVVNLATGVRRTVGAAAGGVANDPFGASEVRSPCFTPDGKSVIWAEVGTGTSRLLIDGKPLITGEDVFPFRVSFGKDGGFVYAADGKIQRRAFGAAAGTAIPFSVTVPVTTPSYNRRRTTFAATGPAPVIGIGSPVLSPDGKSVAFRALNELYLMPIGGAPVGLTKDSFHKETPAFSPDGKWLSYSTDRGGKLDIWLRDLSSGAERQLTHLPDAAVSGSWSRDGKLIAFLDQNGAVYVVEVESGAVQQIAPAMWEPGRPTFSPDGRVVALSAFRPYSARYREGHSEIMTIDRFSGAIAYAPIAPHRSIGSRGDDGPHWSPDGTRIAYVFGSLLYTAPVDAAGKITGAATKLNAEVTDSPSWSGDSQSILYLSNGKLRLIAAAGGAPTPVAMPLTWSRPAPPERTIVRAGRLWDGTGPDVKTNVDIVIEGGKIVAVKAHGGKAPPSGVKFVDASKLTVMPGLIDNHTHRQMQGYSYGDRQGRLWLSFGVTTTHSPGSPAYHGVEERESINSGARIGPRYFTTGEAIDGTRIYYNFMRPVSEEGQLALELQRAESLSYDMLKSYVRAGLQQQKVVIEWGHKRGVPTSGHYHYPALYFGGDCMEHLGATSRFGYSRTVSPAGAGYEDVTKLFSQAQARRTPTLFQGSTLLDEDPGLPNDPRIMALYPSWERAKLVARARAAQTTDQTGTRVALKLGVKQIVDTLAMGGKIVTGTDSPIDLNCVSLHMNLRSMTKYGVPAWQALQTATKATGEYLNAPIGVVAAGYLADLNIVEGDPLSKIEDAAKVVYCVQGGVVHTPQDLMAPFAKFAMAEREPHRHSVMLAALEGPASNKQYWWHDADYVESGRHACCADTMLLGHFKKAAPVVKRRFVAEAV